MPNIHRNQFLNAGEHQLIARVPFGATVNVILDSQAPGANLGGDVDQNLNMWNGTLQIDQAGQYNFILFFDKPIGNDEVFFQIIQLGDGNQQDDDDPNATRNWLKPEVQQEVDRFLRQSGLNRWGYPPLKDFEDRPQQGTPPIYAGRDRTCTVLMYTAGLRAHLAAKFPQYIFPSSFQTCNCPGGDGGPYA